MYEDVTSQIIVAGKVVWPPVSKNDRTHDVSFMKQLAQSIEMEGLLQPIMVRPDPKVEGCYIGVFGRHRHEAVTRILKRDQIEAKVVFMTEEEANLARDSENLWRNPLTKAQGMLAIARWHDYYNKQREAYKAAVEAQPRPPKGRKPKPVAENNAANGVQSRPGEDVIPFEVKAEDGSAGAPEPIQSHPLPPKPVANFAAHVAEVTGQSETNVKRAIAVGKAFSPDQMEVFTQCAVTTAWIETIARMDQPARDAVVNLIAAGSEAADAIATVTGSPEVRRHDGKTYEVTPTAPGEKPESAMNDEEWVQFHCADKLALLADATAFIAHAILYRKIKDIRQDFKVKTKVSLAAAKKDGLRGGLVSVLSRLVNMAHPKHWLRCGGCDATGVKVSEGNKQSPCNECAGNGFIVKIESK